MPPRKKKSDDLPPPAPAPSAPLGPHLLGLSIHLFTAAGAAAGFMALAAAVKGQFPAMFFWLGAALLIDGVDGTFARLVKIEETAPEYDGKVLDLVIDYLTYVIVPVAGIWRSGLMGDDLALGLGLLIVVASSLYFADRRMKMADHFFRGFPALWNVVALYLFVFPMPAWMIAAIIIILCALMFLRVPFVHPMRVRSFRALSIAFSCVWFASAMLAVGQGLKADFVSKAGLIASAVYFVTLTLWRFRVR
jgi:phosphatidylcholine synthase